MVKVYFRRMRILIRSTEKWAWRLERELARATNAGALLSKFPRGQRNTSVVEDSAIRISEFKAAYQESFNELHAMQEVLEELLKELDDPDERGILRLRYIDCYKPEDIAEAICRSDRSVYYIIARAERRLIQMFPDICSDFQ